jgi:hypothetical protein
MTLDGQIPSWSTDDKSNMVVRSKLDMCWCEVAKGFKGRGTDFLYYRESHHETRNRIKKDPKNELDKR